MCACVCESLCATADCADTSLNAHQLTGRGVKPLRSRIEVGASVSQIPLLPSLTTVKMCQSVFGAGPLFPALGLESSLL